MFFPLFYFIVQVFLIHIVNIIPFCKKVQETKNLQNIKSHLSMCKMSFDNLVHTIVTEMRLYQLLF